MKKQEQHRRKVEAFRAAKAIALTIENGLVHRARVNGQLTNYSGARLNDRMFVIGDNAWDIKNPDAWIAGKPVREIFGDFTVMSR